MAPRLAFAAAAMIALSACAPRSPHAPRIALAACGSRHAALELKRLVFTRAAGQGGSAALDRLRRASKADLEDVEVRDYDRDSGVVSCAANLRLTTPLQGEASEMTAEVAFDAQPGPNGRGFDYALSDDGRISADLAQIDLSAWRPAPQPAGPTPPPVPGVPAGSQARPAPVDESVQEDAAAAGDTARPSPRANPGEAR